MTDDSSTTDTPQAVQYLAHAREELRESYDAYSNVGVQTLDALRAIAAALIAAEARAQADAEW